MDMYSLIKEQTDNIFLIFFFPNKTFLILNFLAVQFLSLPKNLERHVKNYLWYSTNGNWSS